MQEVKKPMTRSAMISKISELTGAKNSIVKEIIERYEDVLILELATCLEVKVGPIGKMKVKKTKERTSINPSTGEKVIVASKSVPKFSFSKGLKEYIFKEVN